jgi:hypothetical protein
VIRAAAMVRPAASVYPRGKGATPASNHLPPQTEQASQLWRRTMQEALVVRREQHIAAHVLSRLCMSVALVRSFWQPVFRTTLLSDGDQSAQGARCSAALSRLARAVVRSTAVRQSAAFGASRPLQGIPTIVSFLNPSAAIQPWRLGDLTS